MLCCCVLNNSCAAALQATSADVSEAIKQASGAVSAGQRQAEAALAALPLAPLKQAGAQATALAQNPEQLQTLAVGAAALLALVGVIRLIAGGRSYEADVRPAKALDAVRCSVHKANRKIVHKADRKIMHKADRKIMHKADRKIMHKADRKIMHLTVCSWQFRAPTSHCSPSGGESRCCASGPAVQS